MKIEQYNNIGVRINFVYEIAIYGRFKLDHWCMFCLCILICLFDEKKI